MKIRIGTRKSRLAMVQTEIVKKAVEEKFGAGVEIEIVPITTQGDRNLNRSLTSFGGKGVFTKELEEQLLEGTIDIAVHSAKDMPMEFPEGLCIGAVLEREDPRDVLVTGNGVRAANLAPGSVIGTSSLRRELQIKAINPQVQIRLLRGNVDEKETMENPFYYLLYTIIQHYKLSNRDIHIILDMLYSNISIEREPLAEILWRTQKLDDEDIKEKYEEVKEGEVEW